LLDGIVTARAFSVARRLRTDYAGFAALVRRSSDNLEANIPYGSDGYLNESALLSHCGVGSGFVSVLYDQSSSANNAVQTVLADQPRVVNGGVVEKENGRPCLVSVTNRTHLVGSLNINGLNNLYVGLVGKTPHAGAVGVLAPNFIHWGEAGSWGQTYVGANQTQVGYRVGTSQANVDIVAAAALGNALSLLSLRKGVPLQVPRVNGLDAASYSGFTLTNNNTNTFRLMSRNVDATPFSIIGMKLTEVVIATQAVSIAEIQSMDANQAAHYGIALS
jgi:hypothetical protein